MMTNMVKLCMCLTLWVLYWSAASASAQTDIEKAVDAILDSYGEGGAPSDDPLKSQSGWEVQAPTGAFVVRSDLREHSRALLLLGTAAVEPLIARLGATDDPAIRYMAVYTLNRITNRTVRLPYFTVSSEEELNFAAEEWRRAIVSGR